MNKETQIVITISNINPNHLAQNGHQVLFSLFDERICWGIQKVLDSNKDSLTWHSDNGEGNISIKVAHVSKEENSKSTHSVTYILDKNGKIVK